jgi:hypothetical protein
MKIGRCAALKAGFGIFRGAGLGGQSGRKRKQPQQRRREEAGEGVGAGLKERETREGRGEAAEKRG